MGSTPLGYCWFIYKIGARTGRLTGQFETYAQTLIGVQSADSRVGPSGLCLQLFWSGTLSRRESR